jgi:hypothetical protein
VIAIVDSDYGLPASVDYLCCGRHCHMGAVCVAVDSDADYNALNHLQHCDFTGHEDHVASFEVLNLCR